MTAVSVATEFREDTAERTSAYPIGRLSPAQSVLLLRWVLIVATSYLVIFSRPLDQNPASAALFVALYFTSNVVLTEILPRFRSESAFNVSVVLLDVVMVSTGLALTRGASSDFFVVYFLVLFLSALTERLGLVVGAALLLGAAHLFNESRLVSGVQLMQPAYILRVPFLFVVAMFFGHLVADVRRRQHEADETRARARRMEFLSGVSHDLKNPLGVIQSLATLLLDGDDGTLNEQQTDLVRRIHASTRHVITLALNLIDAARIDAGKLVLQPTAVQAADLVEDALVLARSAAELKGVTLQSSVDSDVSTTYLDAVQMERVISNLVGNAIKFTPPGGMVQVAVHREPRHVVISVQDDGPGIPANALSMVFEKYRRQARGGATDGSGLGLFIVKAIVEAHGGTVQISSSVGVGTTVTVRLPTVEPDLLRRPSPHGRAADK